MDQQRTDAPALDLTTPPDSIGEDALLVEEADWSTKDVAINSDFPDNQTSSLTESESPPLIHATEITNEQASLPKKMTFVGDPIIAALLGRPILIAEPETLQEKSQSVDEDIVVRTADPIVQPQNHGTRIAATAIPPAASTGAWWTLPTMFAGLAIVACAVLVPAADENRRASHELAKIEQDVAHFQKQSEVNQAFLTHVSSDPTLAERLALRQLRLTRPTSMLAPMQAKSQAWDRSPYALVTLDAPTPLPAYQPNGGFLGRWFLDARTQLYLTGAGLLLIAAGLIFGGGTPAYADENDLATDDSHTPSATA